MRALRVTGTAGGRGRKCRIVARSGCDRQRLQRNDGHGAHGEGRGRAMALPVTLVKTASYLKA